MMGTKWVLISVFDREISTLVCDSLHEAQDQMLEELQTYSGVESPQLDMHGADFEIDELTAWSNANHHIPQQDWKIVCVMI